MAVIVGQPRLKDFNINIVVECACETKPIILASVKNGSIFGCGGCKTHFQVRSITVGADGQVQLALDKISLPGMRA